jgi:spheroidene monooxygenase
MVYREPPTADAPPGAPAFSFSGTGSASRPDSLPRAPALGGEVAVMLLADIAAPSRLWGWWRIVRGAQSLRGVPGLKFAKVLGSGHEGGFGLRPSGSRQGLFALFASEAAADDFIVDSATVRGYSARCSELCIVKLRAWSARGRWSGQALAESARAPAADAGQVQVAALTRASIHPHRALAFWRRAPAAQQALAQAPGCLLAAGLGEAPLLRQATFSVWESVAAMDAYARSGAHLAAIRDAQRGGYFSESMFVRFVPLSIRGRWKGAVYG